MQFFNATEASITARSQDGRIKYLKIDKMELRTRAMYGNVGRKYLTIRLFMEIGTETKTFVRITRN